MVQSDGIALKCCMVGEMKCLLGCEASKCWINILGRHRSNFLPLLDDEWILQSKQDVVRRSFLSLKERFATEWRSKKEELQIFAKHWPLS